MPSTSTLAQRTLQLLEYGVLLFFLFLFFIVASPLLPTKQLLSTYAVVTGSMEPTVPVGTLALVQQTPSDQLNKGDVIAFSDPTYPQRTVLHRVTEKLQSGTIIEYKTKGDNNPGEDLWSVGANQVKGRMVFAIPFLGKIVIWAQQPGGFAVLIGIPAGILMLSHLKTLKEGIEEALQRRAQPALRHSFASSTQSGRKV